MNPILGRTSQSIRAARVIGILGLILIHVPPWRVDLGDPKRAVELFDVVFIYCQELFGRASVPLLSVISGYLMVRQHDANIALTRLRKKCRSLLVPLLGWNLIAVVLALILSRTIPYDSVADWGDALLAINAEPAIQPLYFLRDIFMCTLLYPLIRLAIDRAMIPSLIIALFASMSGWTHPLFIGSGPLLFFAIGVAIAMGRLSAAPGKTQKWLIVAAGLLAPAFTTAVLIDMLMTTASSVLLETAFMIGLFVERIFGAAMVWLVAEWTLKQRWSPIIQAIEPYIFLVFCSHILWLRLAWRLLEAQGVTYAHPLYPLFFATAPLQALIVSVAIAAVLRRISPGLLRLLCGGRVPNPPPATV